MTKIPKVYQLTLNEDELYFILAAMNVVGALLIVPINPAVVNATLATTKNSPVCNRESWDSICERILKLGDMK